jgi:type II secretory pathway pseudopilin PulG
MKEGVALEQLADILPPPAPGGADWVLLVMAIVIVSVAALGLLWFVKRRRARQQDVPTHEAQQRLKALRAAWQARTLSDREAAYRLATVLRLGLSLPQLAPHARPAAVDDAAAWHDTLKELQTLRYRNQSSATLSPRCFDRAALWLAAAQRGVN